MPSGRDRDKERARSSEVETQPVRSVHTLEKLVARVDKKDTVVGIFSVQTAFEEDQPSVTAEGYLNSAQTEIRRHLNESFRHNPPVVIVHAYPKKGITRVVILNQREQISQALSLGQLNIPVRAVTDSQIAESMGVSVEEIRQTVEAEISSRLQQDPQTSGIWRIYGEVYTPQGLQGLLSAPTR